MRRHPSLYIAAALSGIAAAYLLNQWVLPWWDAQHRDEPKSPSSPQTDAHPNVDAEVADPEPDTHQTRQIPALPPLHLPNGRAIFSGSSIATNIEAMSSSTSLHTLSSQDSVDEDGVSQSNTSDADTEPFVDVLSPHPSDAISRRRSFRNHDLFAASHISFSELGSLVASEDGH